MKRFVSLFACVLVSSAVLGAEEKPGASSKSGDAVKNVILKIEQEWAAAWVKKDFDWLSRHVATDWTVATENGELTDKAQFDADLKSGALSFESLKIEDMKVRVYGDTAIVSGVETENSKYKDKDTSGTYRFTDVFVKRDGRWQAVATHISRVGSHQP